MAVAKRSAVARSSSTPQDNSHSQNGHPAGGAKTSSIEPRQKLLNSDQVPKWYAENPYLRSGYRPITRSVTLCLQSFTYAHNETVNIYSHLIPAIIALISIFLMDQWFSRKFPGATGADRLVFQTYLGSSVLCFAVSSSYHTFLCHSAHYADFWVRLDYVGIVLQTLGSFVSGIYVAFYCEPRLQHLYWSMIGLLSVITSILVLDRRLQSRKWRLVRLAAFVATGLSAFAPIVHASVIFPREQLERTGLYYYFAEGALIIAGAVFYATHFPESWRPYTFDIWGASHQIFHVLVVLAAVVHFRGITSAFEWNYTNQRCLALPVGSAFGRPISVAYLREAAMTAPYIVTKEYQEIDPPPGIHIPGPAELLELCTAKDQYFSNSGLAVPPDNPVLWIKHGRGLVWGEQCAQNVAYHELRQLVSPVRAPAVFYACEIKYLNTTPCGERYELYNRYIVMEYVPGRTAQDWIKEAKGADKKKFYRLVTLALSELHRIPVPPDSRPAAINGGRIRHLLFSDDVALRHYQNAQQIQHHFNKFLLGAKVQRRVNDLSSEPLVFCYSDIWLGNFIIDQDDRVTVIDFADTSTLPSSFAKMALWRAREKIGYDISNMVYLPITAGVDNASPLCAVGRLMVMRAGRFERAGLETEGGDLRIEGDDSD